jgi:hypothetical protein
MLNLFTHPDMPLFSLAVRYDDESKLYYAQISPTCVKF